MTSIFKKSLGAAAIICGMASMSAAATLSLNGGSSGTIPGVPQDVTPENDILDALFGGTPNDGVADVSLDGFFGSEVEFDIGTTYKVELFGAETAGANSFTVGGQTVESGKLVTGQRINVTTLDSPLASFTFTASAIIEAFVFDHIGRLGDTASVTNGGVNPIVGGANFFASFGDGSTTEGNSLWLFFDDAGVPGDNHDDLAIRISGVVPLPAGGLLLLTAMGGLTIARRRKTA